MYIAGCITKPRKEQVTHEVVKSTILPVNIMTMPDLLSFDILQQTGIKRISQGPFIYNSLMESFENKLKTINKDNSFKSLF
jgi:2-methylisocitrate lyase-like PEP mutase family enzyme